MKQGVINTPGRVKSTPDIEGHWVWRDCIETSVYNEKGKAFSAIQRYLGTLSNQLERGQLEEHEAIRIIIALALGLYQKVNPGCIDCERCVRHHAELMKLMSYEQTEVVRSFLCHKCHNFDLSVTGR